MKIRWHYILLLLTIGVVLSCSRSSKTGKGKTKDLPNIIFIMSDDHGYQAVSAYSDHLIQTPHIDRLAREGMVFDRAFVTNSLCAPSRAVVLTGKHSHKNGFKTNSDTFDGAQPTVPKILQEHGYQTAMFGKWHLKSDPTGFDTWKILIDQGEYYNPIFRTENEERVDSGYVTDLITDFSIDWIETQRRKDQPFFLMCHHKAPHREWLPREDHYPEFLEMDFPEPTTLFDDYEGRGTAAKDAEMRILDHMGLSNDNKINPSLVQRKGYEEFMKWYPGNYRYNLDRMNAAQRAAWDAAYDPVNEEFESSDFTIEELTRWKYQRYMQDYLGTIASVDDNVGRLLNYLDETGLADNTVVIYTSDQGFFLGEHGWFDKRFMYEESFRTPLLMRWPGKISGSSRDHHLVQNLDFAPTMLQMGGVEVPEDMQGRSLLPLFDQDVESDTWRGALYYHYYEYPGIHGVKRHYGVRSDRYKLIHFYHDIDEWEMYDLEEDPDEMNNVYDDPEYSELRNEMHLVLLGLARQYEDDEAAEMAEKALRR